MENRIQKNGSILFNKLLYPKESPRQVRLQFFWDRCVPEVSSDVIKSVQDKTWQKIEILSSKRIES